jgi:hypothetical protein
MDTLLLVSPSTLLFVVRIVAHLWRQEAQTRNAQEIAKRGAELYDKFVGFVEDMNSLDNRLRQAQTEYDGAYGKLASGRGNLVGQAEKLRILGVKPSKSLTRAPNNFTATSRHNGSRVIHSMGRRFKASPYQIGCSLGDGDHGSVGVSADDGRHDGCIDHSETLDTEDTELRVDDPSNPARASRVIEGLRVAFGKGPDVRVAAGCRHEMRGSTDRGKSGPKRNVHRELDATSHAAPIFFGRQKVQAARCAV